MMKKILFPGSFDPITNAHLDIIKRLIKLGFFVEVGILNNSQKKNMLSAKTRLKIINNIKTNEKLENMDAFYDEDLLVNICAKKNINIVARGLRNVKDFEYEKEMELNNKQLHKSLEYIYINAESNLMSISSTVVRELIKYNANISHLVPKEVINEIYK